MHGFRPAHIHFKVSHPDYETLTTQLYFEGDPYLGQNDACGRGCNSDDLRRIIELRAGEKEKTAYYEGVFPVFLKKRGR